jgi:hypothetical protein
MVKVPKFDVALRSKPLLEDTAEQLDIARPHRVVGQDMMEGHRQVDYLRFEDVPQEEVPLDCRVADFHFSQPFYLQFYGLLMWYSKSLNKKNTKNVTWPTIKYYN